MAVEFCEIKTISWPIAAFATATRRKKLNWKDICAEDYGTEIS